MKKSALLKIKKISVCVGQKMLLRDVTLFLMPCSIAVLQGPNGSGKSTLAQVIMGMPAYQITQGALFFDGNDLTAMSMIDRSRAGIFVSYQSPVALRGISVSTLLKEALRARLGQNFSLISATSRIERMADRAGVPRSFLHRPLDSGFSGGERKRLELLQLLVLEPRLAVLDELDAGLDAGALQDLQSALQWYRRERPDTTFLVITHQQSFLEALKPDVVFALYEGTLTGNSILPVSQGVL